MEQVSEALSALNDLELKKDELNRKLSVSEKSAFADRVARAQEKLEALIASGSLTESDLAEVADELLDSIDDYPAIAEMTESEPEPAKRKAKIVSTEKSAPKNAKQEQYIFLANQMVEKFKIIRKAVSS